jgi:hypothetical protein
MRRFFQFRLQTLFVVVTIASLAALWWAHRLHCLERAAFHRSEIARCQQGQAIEEGAFVKAYVRQRNPKRRPPRHLLPLVLNEEVAQFTKQSEEVRKELAAAEATFNKALAESKSRAAELNLLASPPSKRWEDQSVYDSMAQGFLVIPSPMPSQPLTHGNSEPIAEPKAIDEATAEVESKMAVPAEPDLVTPHESKIAALDSEMKRHAELAREFEQAIFRFWRRVDESTIDD